jgi:methyl-accepting chemotaxis protein
MSNSSSRSTLTEKIIAVAFAWEGDEKTGDFKRFTLVNVDNKSYRLAPVGPLLSGGKLKQISRIVLYPDGGNSLPLVTDVIPSSSQIEITDAGKGAEIKFAVRSVWYKRVLPAREAVNFVIKLKAASATDYKSLESADLKDNKLIDNFSPTLADVLTGGGHAPAEGVSHSLKEPDDSLKIGGVLGLEMHSAHPELIFRKRSIGDGQNKEDFYTIEFSTGVFNDGSHSRPQLLRGFNQSFIANRHNRGAIKNHEDFPDADELIVFEQGESYPKRMTARQLPSAELSPNKPTKRRASWLIIIEEILTSDAQQETLGAKTINVWNEVAKSFYNSLRTVRAGNKVSFLPSFQPAVTERGTVCAMQGTWSVGYHLRDAIDANDPDYIVEGNSKCEAGNETECAKYTAFSAWPNDKGNPGKLCAIFPMVFDEARENISSAISVNPLKEDEYLKFQKQPGLRLNTTQLDISPARDVRLGALDLTLGPKPQSSVSGADDGRFFEIISERDLPADQPFFDDERFDIPPDGQPGPTTPPDARRVSVKLNALVNVVRVTPGGQDPPASDEFIDPAAPPPASDDEFKRDPTIILPWQGNIQNAQDSGQLFLIINEANDRKGDDSLKIELRNQKKKEAEEDQKLIIIDPDPFSIVAIKFTPFNSLGTISQPSTNPSNLVGFWVNGPSGPRWQLQSIGDDFSMVLPPQAVGEEMEKHRTIQAGNAINFRFSQPTTIGLSQSEFPQNFREPPWNLRRILEPEDAQASGVKVVFMQYELLYGLSCSFNTKETNIKNLRMMEIFKRFGRIPGRVSEKSDLIKPTKKNVENDPAKVWATLFRQYRARVGVFMPWEPANEQSLILNEGVQCVVRQPANPLDANDPTAGANWQNPFADPSVDPSVTDDWNVFKPEKPTPHNYGLLRGGTTWGFESRNVFTAVMRPNPTTGKIESNTARLIDPEFSSLGGWGNVKATYDNNRSAIYGDAAMGRTFSYTLERIGRIACFWNRAKHVIVYERHVAASTQFVCEQDGQQKGSDPDNELVGLPLLRKTHEYVEILEETRTYPENPLSPPMQRGCVTGCHFTKGQRINVDSMWGSDVGDYGWKVPLWNPTARRDVYPKPVFSIGLESDVAGTSTDCPCQCDNPENVFFYTSTDPKLTADTDAWPAVLDVDYLNLPLPQPHENEYPDGTLLPVFPSDPPVHPGFSPCTFRVVKPASPVNLVAQRADKPLSTLLQNVTMMRSSVRQAAGEIVKTGQDVFTNLHNLNREVANVYAEVFKRLPETDKESIANIQDRFKRTIVAQRDKINELNKAIKEVQVKVNTYKAEFEDKVLARENQILDTLGSRLIGFVNDKGARVNGFVHDLREEYESILDKLLPPTCPPAPANLKDTVKTAIDRMFQKATDTIFMVPLSSNILRRPLEHFRDVVTDAKSRYAARWAEFRKTVEGILSIGEAERLKLQGLVERADAEVRALISNLENFRARLPEAWIPDPKDIRDLIAGALQMLDGYQQALADLKTAIDTEDKARILARVDALLDLAKKAFQPLIDRFQNLKLLDVSAEVIKEIDDPIKQQIRDKLVTWLTTQRDALKAQVDSIDVCKLRDTIAILEQTLLSDEAVNAKVKDLKGVIDREKGNIHILAGEYTRQFTADIDALVGRLDVGDLATKINEAIQNVTGNVAEVFQALDTQRQKFLDLINRAYEDNYKRLQEDAAQVFQSADSAVRLVRAFGPPPVVPNLAFDRPEVAFFYKEAQRFVDVTPVLARVNQAQQAADALKALGVRLPTKQLLNDLVPQPLENFDLRKIFPDFAGLKLDNLFPGLKMPPIANDRVRISHGVDVQTRRAWVQAVIDNVQISEPSTLFAIGPVELSVPKSNFTALTRFEAGQGETPKRQINAKITGDWEVKIGGQSMILFRDTELSFDDAAGLKFRIDPSRIQLSGVLNFVSDLLNKLSGGDSGLSFGLLPDGGIQCVLSLPLPDVQFGAFGISHLNLGALLALRLSDPLMDGFSIELGFNLGRKLAPFALTVFLLGGGGYLEVSTRYAPGNGKLRCFVSLGITVSASLAISLGPIHGGVYIYFGITAEFMAGGGAKFAIGVMLLIRGEVSLLGIVTASISLLLEAQYDTTSGQLIGHGRLSISIEICWCFTLEINEDVTYTVGEGNQSSARLEGQGSALLASNLAAGDEEINRAIIASALPPPPTYNGLATDYINMLA